MYGVLIAGSFDFFFSVGLRRQALYEIGEVQKGESPEGDVDMGDS
jgi:hypothetical protein